MTRRNPWTLTLLLLPLLACKADDPGETDGDVTDGTGDTTNSSTPTTGEPMDCSMIPEIAKQLQLSVKTVEGHRGRIMAKLDVHHVAGLVRHAIRIGLVSADS